MSLSSNLSALLSSVFRLRERFQYPLSINFFKDAPTDKVIAQESWVVIKGKVKCIFYDINHEILCTPILEAGDCSITLEGGHTYEILEDDTVVYEYKTGPYEGQELDKTFIKE